MDPRPDLKPGDEAPPEAPASGENLCAICSGFGEIDGHHCDECAGTGRVETGVGGG